MSPAATTTPDAASRAILEAADRLFYERGIAGVGMDDIRDAAGVSLRRLYTMHPSKRDLVSAWLRDRHTRWMAWFTDSVDRHSKGGTDALVAAFDALDDWVGTPGYRGCAFLNSIAETSEIDDDHRAIVASHKSSLVEHLSSLAMRDHPGAPSWLAPTIAVLIDGAIVQSAVFGDHTPITAARSAALHLTQTTEHS